MKILNYGIRSGAKERACKSKLVFQTKVKEELEEMYGFVSDDIIHR